MGKISEIAVKFHKALNLKSAEKPLPSCFEKITDNITLNIYKFLNKESKIAFSKVCKQTYRLSRELQSLAHVNKIQMLISNDSELKKVFNPNNVLVSTLTAVERVQIVNNFIKSLSRPIKLNTPHDLYFALPGVGNSETQHFYTQHTTFLHEEIKKIIYSSSEDEEKRLTSDLTEILKIGFPVDLADDKGFTALSYLIHEIDLSQLSTRNTKICNLIELLLQFGARPNPKNKDDLNAPFYIFTCKFQDKDQDLINKPQIFSHFINYRANPDADCTKLATCHGLESQPTPRKILKKSSFLTLIS